MKSSSYLSFFVLVFFSLFLSFETYGQGPGNDVITEEVPDMPAKDLSAIMGWIKIKAIGVKQPFCWRQSYGRGAGNVRSRCGAGPETHQHG